MESTLVLDLLLALIIALFVPLGLWRGVAKEVVVSAAILLGALIVDLWAAAWGGDAASLIGLSDEAARFWLAGAVVALSTLLLGYGGGVAMTLPRPGWGERIGGGVLAALNGALLVGLALTFVERYLLAGESVGALDDGVVARTLLHQFAWLPVVGAAFIVPSVVVAAIANARRRASLPIEDAFAPPSSDRLRPVRVPNDADAGKVEPVPARNEPRLGAGPTDRPDAAPVPSVRSWSATSDRRTGRVNGNGAHGGSRFGTSGERPHHDGGQERTADWVRRASAMTRPPDAESPDQRTMGLDRPPISTDPSSPGDAPGRGSSGRSGWQATEAEGQRQQPGWDWPTVGGGGRSDRASTPDGASRGCLACGASIKASDVFCAECGAAV